MNLLSSLNVREPEISWIHLYMSPDTYLYGLLNLESGTEGGAESIQKTRVSNQYLIHITEMVWDCNQTFQNQFCIFGTIV